MANNPYVNKVETADGRTLIDLTSDTVTSNTLLSGQTAHDRSGATITGTYLSSTMREIPFSIATSDWTSGNSGYTATVSSAYVTSASKDFVVFDGSIRLAVDDIMSAKSSGGGGIVFTTGEIPAGTITGNIYAVDNEDGKMAMVVENTVMPIANGGTGAASVAAARNNLGLGNTAGALPVENGGTGAATMTGAQQNLGIIYSASEPSSPVAGMIWLKPAEE